MRHGEIQQNVRQYINGRWETSATTGVSVNPSDTSAVVAEYARVLRPGGQLAYTELTSALIDARWFRLVSRHPADRFTEDDLLRGLEEAGFDVPARTHRSRVGGRWLLGVATRR